MSDQWIACREEDLHKGLPLLPGKKYLVVMRRSVPIAGQFEVGDAHFRFNSAVFLPNRSDETTPGECSDAYSCGIALVERTFHMLEVTDFRLLLAGHTDTVGSDESNVTLSGYRAACVHAVMVGDRDTFKDVASAPHVKSKEDKHNLLIHDQLQIADWAAAEFGWKCSRQDNGQDYLRTFKAFQREYNQHNFAENPSGSALVVDGDWGPNTWGAVFDCYQLKLAQRLMVKRSELDAYRARVDIANRWALAGKPYVTCGEYHPVDQPGRNDLASKSNRRVEVLFFSSGAKPQPACAGAGCDKRECKLYEPITTSRGLPLVPEWNDPLVLAWFADERTMTVASPIINAGAPIEFAPYLVFDGKLKPIGSPIVATAEAGQAKADFNERSDDVLAAIKALASTDGPGAFSFFFSVRGPDWQSVSPRLHARSDGAIYS
jgi:hypothetical protein